MGSTSSRVSGADPRGRAEGGAISTPTTSTPEEVGLEPMPDGAVRAGAPGRERARAARRARRRAGHRALARRAERRRRDLRGGPAPSRSRDGVRSAERGDRLGRRRRTCSSATSSDAAGARERPRSTTSSTPRATRSQPRKRERPLAELERAGRRRRRRGPPVRGGAVAPRHVADRRAQAPLAVRRRDPRGRERAPRSCAPTSAAARPRSRSSPRRRTSAARSTTCARRARPATCRSCARTSRIDPYQLYEAKAAGADAVLLVVGSLQRRASSGRSTSSPTPSTSTRSSRSTTRRSSSARSRSTAT